MLVYNLWGRPAIILHLMLQYSNGSGAQPGLYVLENGKFPYSYAYLQFQGLFLLLTTFDGLL